jgi:hypothetical protein
MKKEDINSILLINKYLTKCKLENPDSQKANVVRKYLTSKLAHLLLKRNIANSF